MSAEKIQEVAKIILERRQNGSQGARFDAAIRPADIDQALAVQDAVTELWCEREDDLVGGYKCLLPSPSATVVGPIYARTINSVAPVAMFAERGFARIEPEFAFFVGRDLPPRDEPYTEAEVDAAFTQVHMALELLHCRFEAPETCSFPEKLADGLVNQGLFIGPRVDINIARAASQLPISVSYNGETHEFAGSHPNGLPHLPLHWLVEHLRSRGQGLHQGQAIITGSYAGVIEVPFNTDIDVDYVGVGKMPVHFTRR